MDPNDLREYATRDRGPMAVLKAAHWRERRESLGPAEALRVADGLRQWCLLRQPRWPSLAEREADLAVHVRVGAALRSIARPA